MRPDVGAVIVNENRDVADNAYGFLGTIMLQSVPLLPKEKLHDAPDGEVGAELRADRIEGIRLPAREI